MAGAPEHLLWASMPCADQDDCERRSRPVRDRGQMSNGDDSAVGNRAGRLPEIRVCLVASFLTGYGLSPPVAESLAERFPEIGVTAIKAGRGRGRIRRLVHMLKVLTFRRNSYDLVLVETFSGLAFGWAFLCAVWARLLGKKPIAVLHGGDLPGFGDRHRFLLRIYFKLVSALVAPSVYLQRWASNIGASSVLIPNHLDLERYDFRHHAIVEPRLYWVRRYDPVYNPQMAIRVLARLVDRYPDSHLLMAGPDSGEKAACEVLAKELKVEGNVQCLGRISKEDINRHGLTRNVFINTTNIDNTPVTLLEAAAMGLPVVTTAVGGIRHLFEDAVEALLVPANDDLAMADAVSVLVRDSELARSLVDRARRKALSVDWPVVRGEWRTVLERVAGSRTGEGGAV